MGYLQEENADIYVEIQKAGFILKFREHNSSMFGKKKGNVDSDIIFFIMKKLYLKADFDRIVLVSSDGDYKGLVDFLIGEEKFGALLFPNKKFASSLYKRMRSDYKVYLEDQDIQNKIDANPSYNEKAP